MHKAFQHNNMRSHPAARRQGGFTLIELMVVVAAGLALVAYGLMKYNDYKQTKEIGTVVTATMQLTTSIRNQFGMQGSYAGLNNNVALRGSQFPRELRYGPQNNQTIGHPWKVDGVRVDSAQMSVPNDSFTLTFDGLPGVACQGIAEQLHANFERVTINGRAIKGPTVTPGTEVAGIANNCPNNNSLATVVFHTR